MVNNQGPRPRGDNTFAAIAVLNLRSEWIPPDIAFSRWPIRVLRDLAKRGLIEIDATLGVRVKTL